MESDGKCMHLGSKETSERGGSRSKKMLSGEWSINREVGEAKDLVKGNYL